MTAEKPRIVQSGFICLIDRHEADKMTSLHNEGCIEDCVFFDYRSAFECITDEMIDSLDNFDKLNEIAARYVRLDDMNRMKFKAVVEKVKPQSLDEVLEISDNP